MTGLSLGMNLVGILGLAAEPVAEMMRLFSRTEPANHIPQMHLDGWSTEQLCYQLWTQLPLCLPTSWMEVKYHYGWYQWGVWRGKNKGKKMCVEGRRETKRITVLKCIRSTLNILPEHTTEGKQLRQHCINTKPENLNNWQYTKLFKSSLFLFLHFTAIHISLFKTTKSSQEIPNLLHIQGSKITLLFIILLNQPAKLFYYL